MFSFSFGDVDAAAMDVSRGTMANPAADNAAERRNVLRLIDFLLCIFKLHLPFVSRVAPVLQELFEIRSCHRNLTFVLADSNGSFMFTDR